MIGQYASWIPALGSTSRILFGASGVRELQVRFRYGLHELAKEHDNDSPKDRCRWCRDDGHGQSAGGCPHPSSGDPERPQEAGAAFPSIDDPRFTMTTPSSAGTPFLPPADPVSDMHRRLSASHPACRRASPARQQLLRQNAREAPQCPDVRCGAADRRTHAGTARQLWPGTDRPAGRHGRQTKTSAPSSSSIRGPARCPASAA